MPEAQEKEHLHADRTVPEGSTTVELFKARAVSQAKTVATWDGSPDPDAPTDIVRAMILALLHDSQYQAAVDLAINAGLGGSHDARRVEVELVTLEGTTLRAPRRATGPPDTMYIAPEEWPPFGHRSIQEFIDEAVASRHQVDQCAPTEEDLAHQFKADKPTAKPGEEGAAEVATPTKPKDPPDTDLAADLGRLRRSSLVALDKLLPGEGGLVTRIHEKFGRGRLSNEAVEQIILAFNAPDPEAGKNNIWNSQMVFHKRVEAGVHFAVDFYDMPFWCPQVVLSVAEYNKKDRTKKAVFNRGGILVKPPGPIGDARLIVAVDAIPPQASYPGGVAGYVENVLAALQALASCDTVDPSDEVADADSRNFDASMLRLFQVPRLPKFDPDELRRRIANTRQWYHTELTAEQRSARADDLRALEFATTYLDICQQSGLASAWESLKRTFSDEASAAYLSQAGNAMRIYEALPGELHVGVLKEMYEKLSAALVSGGDSCERLDTEP